MENNIETPEKKNRFTKNRKRELYVLAVILFVISISFRLLNWAHLEQSNLVFVGLPFLLSLLTIRYLKPTKSPYASVFGVMTLFLLLSSILLGEGIICILMGSPLFYGVAALVVNIRASAKKKNDKLKAYIGIPLLLLIAQPQGLVMDKEVETISSQVQYDHAVDLSALNRTVDFNQDLPSFFEIGFPVPLGCTGNGVAVGDERVIQFESNTRGIGELVLRVAENDGERLVFDVVSDDTHIAHWMTWKQLVVTINDGSAVDWSATYTCDLGPEWYFKPMERYAVGLMTEHLIHTYFGD